MAATQLLPDAHVITVNDAWRIWPYAEILYACDEKWWDVSGPPAEAFAGEKWSSHSVGPRRNDNKTACAERHGLQLVAAVDGVGFSQDPNVIHYGQNSGFQAINLALNFGATEIWLLGFDMRGTAEDPKPHFFGQHPEACRKGVDYSHHVGAFVTAARMLPDGVRILNATPGSALECFEKVTL